MLAKILGTTRHRQLPIALTGRAALPQPVSRPSGTQPFSSAQGGAGTCPCPALPQPPGSSRDPATAFTCVGSQGPSLSVTRTSCESPRSQTHIGTHMGPLRLAPPAGTRDPLPPCAMTHRAGGIFAQAPLAVKASNFCLGAGLRHPLEERPSRERCSGSGHKVLLQTLAQGEEKVRGIQAPGTACTNPRRISVPMGRPARWRLWLIFKAPFPPTVCTALQEALRTGTAMDASAGLPVPSRFPGTISTMEHLTPSLVWSDRLTLPTRGSLQGPLSLETLQCCWAPPSSKQGRLGAGQTHSRPRLREKAETASLTDRTETAPASLVPKAL